MANKNYPRGGAPNETAPDIGPYLDEHLNVTLATASLQELQKKLQEWLAIELAFYRAEECRDEGSPTQQKKELKKYIRRLDVRRPEGVINFIGPDGRLDLPLRVAQRLQLAEYEAGIDNDKNKELYRLIQDLIHKEKTQNSIHKKKIQKLIQEKLEIAQKVQEEIDREEGGRVGMRSDPKKYRILAELIKRLRMLAPSAKKDDVLVCAASILNDPNAMGSKHGPFGETISPSPALSPISTGPTQLRRKLKEYRLSY